MRLKKAIAITTYLQLQYTTATHSPAPPHNAINYYLYTTVMLLYCIRLIRAAVFAAASVFFPCSNYYIYLRPRPHVHVVVVTTVATVSYIP